MIQDLIRDLSLYRLQIAESIGQRDIARDLFAVDDLAHKAALVYADHLCGNVNGRCGIGTGGDDVVTAGDEQCGVAFAGEF